MEKIKFICATRGSSEEFFTDSLLGRSLLNFRAFPIGQKIEIRLFQNNTLGLPSVYNAAIEEAKGDPAILVFCHDDVLLCDFYWVDRILQALEEFQIIGICGNRKRIPRQPSWMYLDEHFTCDSYDNFSGIVGHGDGLPNLTQLSVYGQPGLEVKLLDGMLMAARSSVLLAADLHFDPQFEFHFYDMDFCRQAELRGLKLGTCPVSVIHGSSGRLGTKTWSACYQRYLEKYGE